MKSNFSWMLFISLSVLSLNACKTADRRGNAALKENRETALELLDPGYIVPSVQALLHYEYYKNSGFKHDLAGSAEDLIEKFTGDFKKEKWINEEETRIDSRYFGSLKEEHVRVLLSPSNRSGHISVRKSDSNDPSNLEFDIRVENVDPKTFELRRDSIITVSMFLSDKTEDVEIINLKQIKVKF